MNGVSIIYYENNTIFISLGLLRRMHTIFTGEAAVKNNFFVRLFPVLGPVGLHNRVIVIKQIYL